jgi:hypothetical protein
MSRDDISFCVCVSFEWCRGKKTSSPGIHDLALTDVFSVTYKFAQSILQSNRAVMPLPVTAKV